LSGHAASLSLRFTANLCEIAEQMSADLDSALALRILVLGFLQTPQGLSRSYIEQLQVGNVAAEPFLELNLAVRRIM
jgi:hypothetical protein